MEAGEWWGLEGGGLAHGHFGWSVVELGTFFWDVIYPQTVELSAELRPPGSIRCLCQSLWLVLVEVGILSHLAASNIEAITSL